MMLLLFSSISVDIFEIANFQEIEFYLEHETEQGLTCLPFVRFHDDKTKSKGQTSDYSYSLSSKTRGREVNVPLINSVKLYDRPIKRSAQVGA